MIYVLGSINTDMVAAVPYIPQAGETLTANRFYTGGGGKGANQAVAIARLGGSVKMIGKVGVDAFGKERKQELGAFGVDTAHITEAQCGSGVALILVENGDNRIVLDRGANGFLSQSDAEAGLADAQPNDILVMQLEVPLETVKYAAQLAKKKGMTVILNPAPAVKPDGELLKCVDIVAPNESETAILTGTSPDSEVELALAVKKLYALGAKKVVITLGERGSAIAEGQTITYIPARKVKAVDTTSAGDTFVGALALKLTDGRTLEEAARFASVASSITVTREGAAKSIPSLSEVEAVIAAEKL